MMEGTNLLGELAVPQVLSAQGGIVNVLDDVTHATVSNLNITEQCGLLLQLEDRRAIGYTMDGSEVYDDGWGGLLDAKLLRGCDEVPSPAPPTRTMQAPSYAPPEVGVKNVATQGGVVCMGDSVNEPCGVDCRSFPVDHSEYLQPAVERAVLPGLGGYPTVEERKELYLLQLPDCSTRHLTEMELEASLASVKYSSGQFYPSLEIQRKNLALINHYFYVGLSKAVVGQLGLFLRRRVPAHRRRLFVGVYSGWLTASGHASALDVKGKPGMYSLSLGRRLQMVAHGVDSDLLLYQDANFPLGRANEYIWDPDLNQMRFDNEGRAYLKGTSAAMRAGTEVFVQLGDDYGWRHYWEVLMKRSLGMMYLLASRAGAVDWAVFLSLQRMHLSRGKYTPFLSYLLEHVVHYPASSDTCCALPGRSDTLHDWCVSLFRHREFGHYHIFRQADHPERTAYDEGVLLLSLLESTPVMPPRPGRLRQLRKVRYDEISDVFHRDILVNRPGSSIGYLPALGEIGTFYVWYWSHRGVGARSCRAVLDPGNEGVVVGSEMSVETSGFVTEGPGVMVGLCGLGRPGGDVLDVHGVDGELGGSVGPVGSSLESVGADIVGGLPTGEVGAEVELRVPGEDADKGALGMVEVDSWIGDSSGHIDDGGDRNGVATVGRAGDGDAVLESVRGEVRYGVGNEGVRRPRMLPMELCVDYLTLMASQPPARRGDLNVVFHNVNVLSYDKMSLLLTGFVSHDLDVLVCLDTRVHSSADQYMYQSLIKGRLGAGAGIHFANTIPIYSRRTNHHTSVGGQLVIISPRVGRAASFCSDPSGCGVVTTTVLAVGAVSLLVVGVYVPVTAQEGAEGALWSKVRDFLGRHEDDRTPVEYVHGYIEKMVGSHHRASGTFSVIGGDFNAAFTAGDSHQGVHGDLWEWHLAMGLGHPASLLHVPLLPTRVDKLGRGGTLDHVFICGQAGRVKDVKVLQEEVWEFSDHRPVYLKCWFDEWGVPYRRRRTRMRRPVRYTSDVVRPSACVTEKHRKDLQLYQSKIRKEIGLCPVTTSVDSANFIERLSLKAAAISMGLLGRPRRSYGWSKETIALTMARSTLLNIRRHIGGTHGLRRWADGSRLEKRITDWERWLHGLCSTEVEYGHLSTISGRAPGYWRGRSDVTELGEYGHAIRCLTRYIRRRRRVELQELIRSRHKSMKEARHEGTHLRASKTLLSRGKPFYTLDELQDSEGKIITSPKEILKMANDHFHAWHGKSAAHTAGFHDEGVDRERLLVDRSYFVEQHATTGIPAVLLETIWEALQPPVGLRCPTEGMVREQMRMLATPTYKEFIRQLDATPSRSAPGPSGLTYNMMAALPDEYKVLLYQHLVKLWEDKSICEFWKWRLLSPLPKVDNNITINDIRPLTLIETSRKLWVSIFVGRINSFWERNDVLQDTQHGFTHAKGVDTIHLQHRNMLEENQETCSSLYYSTWDIKRAFDRVPKHILELSWVRLGIPAILARYLVEFDTLGFTIVATPYSRRILGKQGRRGFSLDDGQKVPCFQAMVGTGQGDVGSPDNWKCFFDIALTALRTSVVSPFYVRGQYGVLLPVEDTAFADDLLSASATLPGLQAKADIMSAATMVFGLQMSVGKLRAVQLHWGADHPRRTDNLHIVIHDESWENVHEVRLLSWDDAGPMVKYLGVDFDFDNTGRTQLQLTRLGVLRDLQSLRRKSGPVDVKLDIMFSASMLRAGFVAKYSSWGLGQLQKVDMLYDRECRRLLRLLPTMPTSLLHARSSEPGMELPRFSDRVNLDKLSLFFRGLESQNSTRHAVHGLANRALRLQGLNPMPGYVYFIDEVVTDKPLWVRSLVEWLGQASLRLATGGVELPTMYLPLRYYIRSKGLELSEELGEQLDAHGIYHIQDVYGVGRRDGGTLLGIPWLRGLGLPDRLDVGGAVQIRVTTLQVWTFPPYEVAVEILGWSDETEVHIRRWLLPLENFRSARLRDQQKIRVGCFLRLDPATPSYGAGSPIKVRYSCLVQGGGLLLVLGPDQWVGGGIRREVVHLREILVTERAGPSWVLPELALPKSLSVLQGWLERTGRSYHIFTDASVKFVGSPVDRYFFPGMVGTIGAAIVLQPQDVKGLSDDTIVVKLTDLDILARPTVYMLETLAAITAAILRQLLEWRSRPTIYLDCKGVVSNIRYPPLRPWKRPTFQLLHALKLVDGGDMCWTRSHPERRGKMSSWSYVAHGNHLADRAASAKGIRMTGTRSRVLELSCKDIMPMLLLLGTWSITLGGVTHLREPLDTVLDAMHRQYLQDRDGGRQRRGASIKWSQVSLAAAARWCVMNRRAYERSARNVRLVYDWYWHGARAVLHLNEKFPQALPCPLCAEVDSQYHMVCGCQHPDVARCREGGLLRLQTFRGQHQPTSWRYKVLTALMWLLMPKGFGSPEYPWTGVYTRNHVEYLRDVTPRGVPYQHLSTLLNLAGQIIIETTRAVVKTRFLLVRRAERLRGQFRRKAFSYPAAVYRKGPKDVVVRGLVQASEGMLTRTRKMVIQPTIISSLLGSYRGTGHRLTDGERVEVARVSSGSESVGFSVTDYDGGLRIITRYQLCTLCVTGFILDRMVLENISYLVNRDIGGIGGCWIARLMVVDSEVIRLQGTDDELLRHDYVMVPVVEGAHFFGFILDVRRGHVYCLDSLGRRNERLFGGVLKWIGMMRVYENGRRYISEERRLVLRAASDWTYSWIGLPRQVEPLDGGICMLHVMVTIIQGQEIRYSRAELQLVRDQLTRAVLHQDLVLARGTISLQYDQSFGYLTLGSVLGGYDCLVDDATVKRAVESYSPDVVPVGDGLSFLDMRLSLGSTVGDVGYGRGVGEGVSGNRYGRDRRGTLLGQRTGDDYGHNNGSSGILDADNVAAACKDWGYGHCSLDAEVRVILREYGIVWEDGGELRDEYEGRPATQQFTIQGYDGVELTTKSRHSGLFGAPWWLNESDINFFLGLWNGRSMGRYFCVRSETVSSCFQGNYLRYDLVARNHVGMGVPFMNCPILHIPINVSQTHWVGVIVYLDSRHVQYYDSFNIHRPGNIMKWYTWFKLELKQHAELGLVNEQRFAFLNDDERWTYSYRMVPAQTNGYDCGIFVLLVILSHIMGVEPGYHQGHLMLIREQLQLKFLRQDWPEFVPMDYKGVIMSVGSNILQLTFPVYREWHDQIGREEYCTVIEGDLEKRIVLIDLTRESPRESEPEFWEHFPMRPD